MVNYCGNKRQMDKPLQQNILEDILGLKSESNNTIYKMQSLQIIRISIFLTGNMV
jgi:hypothetical protein